MRPTTTASLVVLVSVAIASVVVSCSSDRALAPEIGALADPPGYVSPTSPERVLQNLVVAHERRDIDGYAACFADDFVFVPSPSDNLRFDHLSREEDLACTRRMFREVERIEMSLVPGPVEPSDRVDLPAEEGYLRTLARVDIRLTLPGQGPDRRVLAVVDDRAHFVFEPEMIEGVTTYRIVRQEDRH